MSLTLMVQGTTSDAGKSILVAGLCRWFTNNGVKVVPFKPQNMALNSAVTANGGEIGRAQALQAEACMLEPHTDMNPVLLKPSSDMGAQVIIQGRALQNMDAQGFHDYKKIAMDAVLDSYQRLCQQYDTIIVEGAGSPAEINLRKNDIANMGFAEAVDCPVIIIADIDRGGVFAHLVGTLALLSESEQNRVKGFVINKFRGDIALLQPGLDWLEERTGKPVLGVLPYLPDFYLDAEDAISQQQHLDAESNTLKVLVPVLPRISNHTDFDPLRLHPHIELSYVSVSETPPPADLVILPGSKNVRKDMQALMTNGWQDYLKKHLRYGGKVLGICGGFQMLGDVIADPEGIEDRAGSCRGFGFLNVSTELTPHKALERVSGMLVAQSVAVQGYEIHCGITTGQDLENNCLQLDDGRQEGVLSLDNQIMGTYLHGLFDTPEACQALLNWAGLQSDVLIDTKALRHQQLERLAATIDECLDIEKLLANLEKSDC